MSDLEKAEKNGLAISQVFGNLIRNVVDVSEKQKFKGVVDIGVDFKSVAIDKSGILGVFSGKNTSESSLQIRIATRVHIE